MKMRIKACLLAVCMLFTAFGLFGEEPPHPIKDYYARPAADPLEGFNRCMEGFNAGCVKYIVYPVGKCYTLIMPKFVREGIGNFADNLQFPLSFVNNCLQGKFEGAWNETKRFGINTTVGILGIRDQASAWGIMPMKEDFGQTFGHYGSGPWFYLHLPFIGPCSGRDGVGMLLGFPFDIANYLFGEYSIFVKCGVAGNDVLNMSSMINEYFSSRYETYELTRAAYLCYRDALITDFASSTSDGPSEYEESMGYIFLKARNERFGWNSVQGSVHLSGAKDRLPYTVWLPKKRDGRVVFLLPGIGAWRGSAEMAALAELFVTRGWTVVSISNTYSADYFLHTGGTQLPGRPSVDCIELEMAMGLVKADVERRFPQKLEGPQETVVVGLSLGAINTLHLAARTQRRESACPFNRYVAINPPVDPWHALRVIDSWFDIPMSWPEETRELHIKETLQKVAGLVENKTISGAPPKLTLDESRFVVGLNIRLALANLLVASREKFAPAELMRYPKTADLSVLKHRALDVSYDDFVNKILVREGEDAAALGEQERLTHLEDALKAADNVFVMHNRNDFLMTAENMAWIEATFGERAVIFPRGGHLGNLFTAEAQEVLIKLATGEK
ncbi:MAG: VacJ family lipoprotein [Victivallales bacterium]|nr:VacJ family lipoprotein [Victivallales bacterium]